MSVRVASVPASAPAEPAWGTGLADLRAGDACLYRRSDGTRAAATVVAVDRAISPPDVTIRVDGTTRSTELERLARGIN